MRKIDSHDATILRFSPRALAKPGRAAIIAVVPPEGGPSCIALSSRSRVPLARRLRRGRGPALHRGRNPHRRLGGRAPSQSGNPSHERGHRIRRREASSGGTADLGGGSVDPSGDVRPPRAHHLQARRGAGPGGRRRQRRPLRAIPRGLPENRRHHGARRRLPIPRRLLPQAGAARRARRRRAVLRLGASHHHHRGPRDRVPAARSTGLRRRGGRTLGVPKARSRGGEARSRPHQAHSPVHPRGAGRGGGRGPLLETSSHRPRGRRTGSSTRSRVGSRSRRESTASSTSTPTADPRW